MRRIKKIMVATDLTADSNPAHLTAAYLAEKIGASLVIFHVLGDIDPKYEVLISDMASRMRADAEHALDEASTRLNKDYDIEVTTVIREGAVLDELSLALKEFDIDVLVMGTGAVHTGQANRLGLFAKRVAHKIPHDLVFARHGCEGPWHRLLVATDFSSCSGEALERACRIAKHFGIKGFPVVHAFEVPLTFLRVGLDEREVRAKLVAHAQKEMDDWLAHHRTHWEGLDIEKVVLVGKPDVEVVSEATRRSTQLVVVGSHGRTASAAVLLGNVAERILRDAPCSVWAERSEDHGMDFAHAIARIMGIE